MHLNCSKFSILSNVEQLVELPNALRKPLLMYTLAHLFLPSTSSQTTKIFNLRPRERNCRDLPLRAMPWFHEHPEQLVLEAEIIVCIVITTVQSVVENPLGAATTVNPA